MKGTKHMTKKLKLWGLFSLIMIMGCEIDEMAMNPNTRYVHLIVKPDNSRVVVKSMSDSKIITLTPPYDFRYILRPYQATYIEVTHKGYRKKIIKLDGTREEIKVKLEKMTEEEKIMLKYKTEAAGRAGPGLDDIPGVSGGVGGPSGMGSGMGGGAGGPGIGSSGGMGGDMGGGAGGFGP